MILHVDMDAFYASIEVRDRPELLGKPVIVGGTPAGRGVVAAASYEVRRFGVHSAMPTATALRLCPQAIVLPPRMDYYGRISEQIRDIFFRYTPLVEPLSLDEAFLDVAGSQAAFGPAIEIARQIKRQIAEETGLNASVGIAPNKFLAKIASDLKKPNALVFVDPTHVQQFLDPLPVGRIWGVGRVTGETFSRLGIETIGQLRQLSLETLRTHFGQAGEHFHQLAAGIDPRPVVPDREAKSISHETTFAQDIEEPEVLRAWLRELTEHVGQRLRRHRLRGRTVQVKVRFADFQTITRAQTLTEPTNVTEVLWQAAVKLLSDRLPQRRLRVRLLGVGVSGLDNRQQVQMSLFDDPSQAKQSQLDAVADSIQARFGASALSRGSSLLHNARHRPAPRPGQ